MRISSKKCPFILTTLLMLGRLYGDYITPEFKKSGETYRYVWQNFYDAEIVKRGEDNRLQILAVRSGILQQKVREEFHFLRKVQGLWHAYQDGQKKWVSNGSVLDITSDILERFKIHDVPYGTYTENLLTACSDQSGRLHAIVKLITTDDFSRRYYYAVRDVSFHWHGMLSIPISDDLIGLCCFYEDGKVHLFGFKELKEGDSQIVEYEVWFDMKGGQPDLHWSRKQLPESLEAGDFAVFPGKKDTIVFYRKSIEIVFRSAWRDGESGKWNLSETPFDPCLGETHIGNTIGSLCGFLGADGLFQVFGIMSWEKTEGVVHFYRDSSKAWKNNGLVLRTPADLVSACPDGQGLINLIGISEHGQIWHAYRDSHKIWRNNGTIFTENSR